MSIEGGVIAVIIGRAGSKGLPGKNTRRLLGKPMVWYTIQDAKGAGLVDRIVVSTDCEEMKSIARGENLAVVDRPAGLAGDTATVDAAVRHAIETDGGEERIVVILYANVPVRPDGLIDRAVRKLIETGADSVQSYCDVGKHHPLWTSTIDLSTSTVTPYQANVPYRRQDLPERFLPDGGVIAVRRESLFTSVEGEPHAFLGRDRRGIITPSGSVIDVDSEIDSDLAHVVLTRRLSHASAQNLRDADSTQTQSVQATRPTSDAT
ncbi:MAG: acylneuraminate cytidylyltransferase family protein [Planctomycetota bacterium]|nr:acylneuraminate cytidylyltransferase family protein [Planctomycetota bacterium]